MKPGGSDAVRGTRDMRASEVRQQDAISQRLAATLEAAGYEPVEVPLLEHRALYLKKAGDDLLAKLYHWTQGGRELALRPEWTASVLRSVVPGLGAEPKPVRLRYAGPVFRYERPSRGRYRQFTQVGLELLGASGPQADAEVLGLAVEGLHAVALHDYTITIGHIGVIKQLFGTLGLAERTVSALTWSLERVRNQGLEAVRAHFSADDGEDELPLDWSLLRHLSDSDIETLLLNVLPGLGVRLDGGGRNPQAVVHRLVRKLRHSADPAQLERAWQLLGELSATYGAPEPTLERIGALLQQFGLPTTSIDELREMLAILPAYGVPLERVRLDFGLGRGLHYYTGMIFEIDGASGLQLCGGGRYDELIAALGGAATPAVGFAYGLERVVAAAPAQEPAVARQVLVGGTTPALGAQAARQLRSMGWRAVLDVRGSQQPSASEARRRGFVWLAQATAQHLLLRNLDTGVETMEAWNDPIPSTH